MKKILALLICILSSYVFAETSIQKKSESNFQFSLEGNLGVKKGELGEYVFYLPSEYESDLLSYLNWGYTELCAKLQTEFVWRKTFATVSFCAGAPLPCGTMTDSDWLNVEEKNAADYQYKTNYSESENNLNYDFDILIRAGFKFKPISRLSILPFVGFSYQYISFTAEGGTAWYGNGGAEKNDTTRTIYSRWNDAENQTVGNFSGKVITYERETLAFAAGLGAQYDFSKWQIRAWFFVAPFTKSVSKDRHHLRKMDFADETGGTFRIFDVQIECGYEFSEKMWILFCANARYTRLFRGDTFSKSVSNSKYAFHSTEEGGADAKMFGAGISFKIQLF